MEFNHKMLPELFEGIRLGNPHSNSKFDSNYYVSEAKGDVAQITYLGNNEWRFYIDNFPSSKKYYSTNFSITTVERFILEMRHIGLELKLKSSIECNLQSSQSLHSNQQEEIYRLKDANSILSQQYSEASESYYDIKQQLSDLQGKMDEQVLKNEQLLKGIQLMAESKFTDCFLNECDSQNECQTFGCEKLKKRNQNV